MAITYPRTDIMTLTKPGPGSTFDLSVSQEVVRDAGGGLWARDIAPAHWVAHYESAAMSHGDAVKAEAALRSLDGGLQLFEAEDMRHRYPAAYADGVFTDSGVIDNLTSDRTQIRIASLPANFVITAGDYFHFTYGGIRYLFQAMEDITANGTGVTVGGFTIRPHIPLAVDSGALTTAVKFKTPAMRAVVVPGSVRTGAVDKLKSRVSFDAVQSFV